MLTLAFVTGTEPGKWLRRYEDSTDHGLSAQGVDDPFATDAVLKLVRLPDARVSDAHHVVRLYEETPGVAVPKDSVFAEVGEAVAPADLAGEIVNADWAEGASISDVRAALQVVAANVGVAYAPLPLLKNLSKKQVVPLELADATRARTTIALVWLKDDDGDAVQDFVGVAKGRTMNSSRSQSAKGKESGKAAPKKGKKDQRTGKKQKYSQQAKNRRNYPRMRGKRRG